MYGRADNTCSLGTDHLTWRGGGGYGLLFRSEYFFSDNTRIRIFFFLSGKARIFFPEFHIRLNDKNWIRLLFFFLHLNQNIFLEKNHKPPSPPFKLNGHSLRRLWETKLKRMKTTNIVFFQSIKSNSSRIVQDITAKIKLDLCVVVKSIV
jgi:hypothetical protein